MNAQINTGSTIRSFDFTRGPKGFPTTGERACFMEGTVTSVLDGMVYFTVTRRVFSGKDCPEEVGRECRCPIATWRGNRLETGALEVVPDPSYTVTAKPLMSGLTCAMCGATNQNDLAHFRCFTCGA